MYSERMEALISAALTDGVLTEKERKILYRNAEEEGIDLDEFEMVLEARLTPVHKSNKLGEVRKCPQCGAVIGSFQMTCPECGYEFSGVGPNKFVEKFSSELQKTLERQDGGSGSIFEIFDPMGVYKDRRRNEAIVKAETLFVKNYPLPMTKEDCLEMLNYILPRTQLYGSTGSTKAWRNKFFAILSKLEFENRNNPRIRELVAAYRKQAKMSAFGQVILWYKALSTMAKTFLWLVVFYSVFFGVIGYFASNYLW